MHWNFLQIFSSNKTLFLAIILIALLPFKGISQNEKVANQHKHIDNQFVIDWNHLTYQIAYEHDKFYSLKGIRTLTMVHLAIHDALNVVIPKFETYAYSNRDEKADPIIAASVAASIILNDAYPKRKDTITIMLEKYSKSMMEEKSMAKGEKMGKEIASNYLQLRAGDGHEKQGDYTPMSKPGDYQYTPGWNNWVLKPDFAVAKPFSMETVIQFRSPAPPTLDSKQYTNDLIEVKMYGCMNSSTRTKDQTFLAHWWAEFAEHSWNRIGRLAASEKKLSAWETARMFAFINMDIYDIYLASLESKYYYDTWRPYTAIRNADQDQNPNTIPDHHWEPEMLTPPWPEYPSAHAAVAAGGAEIMTHVLGSSNYSFSMESTSALPESKTRSFTDLYDAAEECAESRIMNGYHFRFATDEGLNQGKKIAKYIHSNFLRPIDSK